MRVIAGTARSIKLKTIEGAGTRPTTDRTKETLFNVLHSELPGAAFLDLFSGSGAIGTEALSRGARQACLVEQNRQAVQCIRENLAKTRLEEGAMVMECDVMTALIRLEGKSDPFDIVFMDPPYDHSLEKQVLSYLSDSELITEDTTIVVEASLETEFVDAVQMGFEVYKVKQYKTNQHVFLCRISQRNREGQE